MRGDVHKALKQHQAMTGLYFEAKDQANHILPLVIQLGAEVFFQSCQMTTAWTIRKLNTACAFSS